MLSTVQTLQYSTDCVQYVLLKNTIVNAGTGSAVTRSATGSTSAECEYYSTPSLPVDSSAKDKMKAAMPVPVAGTVLTVPMAQPRHHDGTGTGRYSTVLSTVQFLRALAMA